MLASQRFAARLGKVLRPNLNRGFCYCPTLDQMEISTHLDFAAKGNNLVSFTTMDHQGNLLADVDKTSSEEADILKKVYRTMREVELIDNFLNKAQRQGLIADLFYTSCFLTLEKYLTCGAFYDFHKPVNL